jgi:uncharacterized protein with beta-barrel porin domain
VRNGSTFALNGSVGGGVTVDPGGVFNGLGSVGGLTVGGTWNVPAFGVTPAAVATRTSALSFGPALAATASPTLVVNGNLTTTDGSTVNIEATPGPTAPVQVNGTASFTGTHFNVSVNDDSSTRLTSYSLVSANAVTLANSAASTQAPTLVPYLYTDTNTLKVSVLNLGIPLAAVPTTGNGRSVAGAVDTLKTAPGQMGTFVRNLAGLDDSGLRDALDQLPGEVNVTDVKMAVMDSEAITDMIRSEMSRHDDEEGDARIAVRSLRPRWWAELMGQHAHFGGRNGLHGATVDVGGLAGGFDLKRTEHLTFGAGLSFTAGGLSMLGLNESSQLQAPRAFGYAGVQVGPFRFHGGGSAAKTNMSSDRQIHIQAARAGDNQPIGSAFDQTAEADRDGTAQDVWSEWQDTLDIRQWRTESKVGWRHARFGRQPFTETGGGPVSLVGDDNTLTSTESDILISAYKKAGSYRPNFMFTYRREFGDQENSANVQFVDQPNARFQVDGLPLARNTVMARSGLTVRTGSGLEYTFEYEFRHAESETRHSGDFRIRFR